MTSSLLSGILLTSSVDFYSETFTFTKYSVVHYLHRVFVFKKKNFLVTSALEISKLRVLYV